MDALPMDATFHALHRQPQPLILTNAWDAGSARLIASLGAPAIATTSAGVAWSLGYRDGDVLPLDEHVACVRRIRRVTGVPLTVDIESGYSDDPAAVGAAVARFVDAGAVGINLQDGAAAPELLCRKIGAARAAAGRAGVNLYINIRCDVFARQLVPAGAQVGETLRRAHLYREAGANGLFPLAVTDPADIAELAAGTDLLLNVIAWPGLPPVAELAALGVRRVSTGSWLPQALWAHASRLVREFTTHGRSPALVDEAEAYATINGLLPAAGQPGL
ncbi:isocitrate lyase/PEP mutase family protein [Pseudoduganella umbonata]|uniref:2-methylisocitrate lyase-like PEP mutase family enzyme n=1 Tax=Pseudoduganella umbonata TaxID=864828 RepID=A0A4P8HMA5_9BURK|nr:isocitrate lyase/phosphoenolpyruvate mutase family protein [Pseudoduganella umbonata]MBB3219353.1 2-methylisocitrate lyase-like PEP mutase family enzyme [Pseudoduganella umbonata]QCP09450.1 isocitrate lyase/phosphoenolpyruvate mutase family protein [Pseudoduganella umbonata]